MIRGFADLLLFSDTCVATAAAFWARSSAAARRRGWFCMRGRLVNDAIAARFAGPAPNRRYFPQDIMAIGHDGKRSEHDREKACPALDAGWYRFSEKIMLIENLKRDENFIPL